ncbi:MAG: A/G-specific adenine glycosylase [Bacteroidales bacterium]|nr:A/G-specific adenine glycosylase [Bacteroidales bacterium]
MKFSVKLISWYEINKRHLPWRNTPDPYKIWISEIILQQTRVDQGFEYYNNFVKKFPDVRSLAESDEQDVLKLWQGLGYYSRARNLHLTAREIVSIYQGHFPANYKDILKLKGIGEYTAAAICSFAFDLPYPVVDGNVMRFLSRLKGLEIAVNTIPGKKTITTLATELMDKNQPGIFNQAIMEFGALYCKPLNPDCNSCIFKFDCLAHLTGKVRELPLKEKQVKQKSRYFYYLLLKSGSQGLPYIYLRKRVGNDIWKNLYDFPLVESDKRLPKNQIRDKIEKLLDHSGIYNLRFIPKNYRHILTHRIIHAQFIMVEFTGDIIVTSIEKSMHNNLIKVHQREINLYPIPRLIEKFMEENDVFGGIEVG